MSFIKQNMFFFSLIVLCLVLFGSLQFVSCNLSENIEATNSLINKEIQKTELLKEDLLNFQGLLEDSESANQDLVALAKIEKEQTRFWASILAENQNIFSTWKKKSPESINADITRLYSNLREICKENNIQFEEGEIFNTNSFEINNQESEIKYGFGLSSYDGFWPSFSNDEARLLGIQSKVVAMMIDFLTEASTPEHSITLIQILREPVGDEDSQHIAGDILSFPNLKKKLVRFDDGVGSFAFLIKFKSHTSHARSFINQLRPPFLLRDLVITRSEDSGNLIGSIQNVISPFGVEPVETEQPLPIVQNVESEFTLLIEYVYEVKRDLENFLVKSIDREKINYEILNKFLENSGNSKIISKITKTLKNRENR